MNLMNKKAQILGIGFVTLAGLGVLNIAPLAANNLAGLRALNIHVNDNKKEINSGESVFLSAEGDYFSFTAPLRALWEITKGKDLAKFPSSCDAHTNCRLQAGTNKSGDVTVRATVDRFYDDVTIHIRDPRPKAAMANPFKDDLPDWAEDSIVDLSDRNIIHGYDNGTYGAGDKLTNGQLVTIFYRTLLDLDLISDAKCNGGYNDVGNNHYAHQATCAFRTFGWTDQRLAFYPDAPATRGETAALLNRVLGPAILNALGFSLGDILQGGQTFLDIPEQDRYYGDTLVTNALGYMKGDPNGTFRTADTLVRAEGATIFSRVIRSVEENGVRKL